MIQKHFAHDTTQKTNCVIWRDFGIVQSHTNFTNHATPKDNIYRACSKPAVIFSFETGRDLLFRFVTQKKQITSPTEDNISRARLN
nr:hypothetical protein [Helicoverpa armigera nucleopolyhedrovirus]